MRVVPHQDFSIIAKPSCQEFGYLKMVCKRTSQASWDPFRILENRSKTAMDSIFPVNKCCGYDDNNWYCWWNKMQPRRTTETGQTSMKSLDNNGSTLWNDREISNIYQDDYRAKIKPKCVWIRRIEQIEKLAASGWSQCWKQTQINA